MEANRASTTVMISPSPTPRLIGCVATSKHDAMVFSLCLDFPILNCHSQQSRRYLRRPVA
jgi:hypothetical protein